MGGLALHRGSGKKFCRVRRRPLRFGVELIAKQARRCIDFRFAQAVQNERAAKVHASKKANVESVIKSAFTGCGKPAVGCKVLGVRDRDVFAEEVKGLFPYGVQLRKLIGVEKI